MPHLHFEDDDVFSHLCFQRQQCLHLHFEDKNVFSHFMLSKGDNALIYAFKDDNVFNSENFNVFIFSQVLLLGLPLVAGGMVSVRLQASVPDRTSSIKR